MGGKRRFVGLPLIVVGFGLLVLGLSGPRGHAFVGSGITFVIIGIALTKRYRKREAI